MNNNNDNNLLSINSKNKSTQSAKYTCIYKYKYFINCIDKKIIENIYYLFILMLGFNILTLHSNEL